MPLLPPDFREYSEQHEVRPTPDWSLPPYPAAIFGKIVLCENCRRLGRCARILAVQTLKLFLMFTLPWFCIRFMGLSCGLSFWQVQLLTSLMLFLSNALPNVAGMGSIETAFLLVFSSFMTSGEAMSTLMLFRIASYYFVFAASAAGTFAAQKHLENS